MFTTTDIDGQFVSRPMAQQEIEFDGDEELGHRVVHALPFTI